MANACLSYLKTWSRHIAQVVGSAMMAWKAADVETYRLVQRYVMHSSVLILTSALLIVGGLPWLDHSFLVNLAEAVPVRQERISAATPARSLAGGATRPLLHSSSDDVQVIHRQAQPYTEIPYRQRLQVITYTVQPGDTVQGIAIVYGLEDTTLMWSNPAIEDMPDFLQIGQQVVILPIDGVYHTVKSGDTLDSIAAKYKVTVTAITDVSYNHLPDVDGELEPGHKLIVAGGQKPYVPKIVTAYTGSVPEGARGTGRFQWPATGSLTQGYWWGHRAIDIASYVGAPIYAADGGFVSFAGWTDIGYGYLLIIDHANGFATYYAHLNGFYASVGQRVTRGQLVGAMGNTGNSTGPHIHFEIRSGNTPLNPRAYLP